jgi:hypothetical protein
MLFCSSRKTSGAFIVESGAIDERLIFRQSEQPRAHIAGLLVISDSSGLNEAKAQCGQSLERDAVLVKAGGQTNRILKRQPESLDLTKPGGCEASRN